MANVLSTPQPVTSPGPVCPACGKSVDPIRAGHVAILGGRFVYFCDAACKQQYMRSPGVVQTPEDVATMEPPQVAWGNPWSGAVASAKEHASASRVSLRADAPLMTEAVPEEDPPVPVEVAPEVDWSEEPTADPSIPAAVSSVRSVSSVRTTAQPAPPPSRVPSVPREDPPPRTLRSPASDSMAPPEPRSESRVEPRERPVSRRLARSRRSSRSNVAQASALRVLYATGVAAGVLVGGVGLAGDLADALRLPLIGVATVACLVRLVLERRDPAAPHRLVALLPVIGAAGAAAWSGLAHDAHSVGIAVFAGLAAACTLGTDLLVARLRAGLATARTQIARGLDLDARVVRGEDTVVLAASEVKPGEQVIVEAGEGIGVDAVVTAGEATVAPWLDASVEVPKREGDSVVAGGRVTSGRLRLTTTWSGPERAWWRLALSPALRIDVAAPMAYLSRVAVERGAPVAAALVGMAAFANGGRPAEVLAAASAAALAFGVRGAASVVALHHARAQLSALQNGIVYKDARSFERAGFTHVAVLCSRGTLLLGEPEIVAIESLVAVLDVARVLALAAGAETASTHPFASAILRAARTRGVRADNVRNATVHSGLGVTALASTGERLVVGGRALMLQEKISIAAADERISELEAQGRSVLLVALGDRPVGLLALQDGLRAGARAAVQRLLDARLEPVLLSGEARETCVTLGGALDIDHIRPEVLPTERGAEVRALGEGGHVVAVLGHPATDDGALGAADVAVAMGAAGATPGEWAVALASDDVRDAALALTLPHTTRDRVRVALGLGFAPGAVALLALVFGIAPLAVAPVAAALGVVAAALHAREKRVL